MLNTTLNPHWGYTPAAAAPSNAITPEQGNIFIIALSAGVDRGGPALSPSVIYQCFVFHTILHGILQSQNISKKKIFLFYLFPGILTRGAFKNFPD
jgi:hypothetical protein